MLVGVLLGSGGGAVSVGGWASHVSVVPEGVVALGVEVAQDGALAGAGDEFDLSGG